jgi:hypothetical protein
VFPSWRGVCAAVLIAGGVPHPLAAQADSLPVTFTLRFSGFVLGQVTEPVDPFYHASAMLHVIATARVGTNVEVPVRVLAEAWSFSQPYGFNITTVRPAIRVAWRGRSPRDSLVLLVGDLWRVRHGQGLALDDFESQGGIVNARAGRWRATAALIGYGWAGPDDLYTLGLEYHDRVAVRLLDDSPDVPAYAGSRILSADGRLALPVVGEVYGEIGRNVDRRRWGALVGLRRTVRSSRNEVRASLEFRHYDSDFFGNETNAGVTVYPYFGSLTALDKPLHNFQLYQAHRGRHDVVAARVQGRASVRHWFVDGDVEGITGTIDELGYEASVGVEANAAVDLRTGVLNKFFRFPTAGEGMFSVRDTPWWFLKVTIRGL